MMPDGEAAVSRVPEGAPVRTQADVREALQTILKSLEDSKAEEINPIDIAGAAESFKKEITLDLVESVTVLFPAHPIQAQIDIAEKLITRSFKDLPLKGRNTGFSYSITPPVISLDVKGPANIVNVLETSEAFMVYLDLEGLKPGVFVRRATIILPVTTALVGASPEIFTVTLK